MTSAPASSAVLAERPAARWTLRAETAADYEAVEALNDRVFGPGRFAKVSYAVRELARFRPDLSFCAWDEDRLIGSVRQSVVSIGGRDILFLGPFAVGPEGRGLGVGAALMGQAIEAGYEAGFPLVVLVGDPPLFDRYGFVGVEPGRIALPRPVDPRRLLWRVLREGGDEDVAGPVAPPGEV
jgi:predicted N-acetyltransferase YhbS